jgi:hypothetical protein
MASKARRSPTPQDITALAEALAAHGVEYVVIGGAAMALHGFPRMTKDIDLFLPIDAENNRRLLKALKSVPNSAAALAALRPQYMDQGYSTSLETDVPIDLLYVAASRKFEDLRAHIKPVQFNGVVVSTLDVDGMLMSKDTTRDEDLPDRLKLQRLRNALFDQQREARTRSLAACKVHKNAAVRLFGDLVEAQAEGASGKPMAWKKLETKFVEIAARDPQLAEDDIADAVCNHSPGAVLPGRQAAIREEVRNACKAARKRKH